MAVRPILGSGTGVADSRIDGNRVVIELPSTSELSGTRAVAEVTLRGIARGRATVTFDPPDLPGASVTTSQAVVEVK